ncbi:MAG: hypothetical protein ACPHTD_13000, partial [Gammaproteobacteria bacterium]
MRQFLGLLLLMFSVSLMPACAIATLGQENGTLAWLILAGVTATSGLILWSPGRHTPMQLLRAETSGPMKDDKLAPRISKTARYLWSIYGG